MTQTTGALWQKKYKEILEQWIQQQLKDLSLAQVSRPVHPRYFIFLYNDSQTQ